MARPNLSAVPERYAGVVTAILVSNMVSLSLFGIRVLGSDGTRFWFLFWNLLLAWVPLLLAVTLVKNLKHQPWAAWQNIALTITWLAFLPNSFYIVSDLIHLHLTGEINILFDTVLFFSCIFNGFVFGMMSVYLVHGQLIKRLPNWRAHTVIGLVFGLCGLAIYIGRYLRWNTWDILVHPAGVLFDLSGRVVNPAAYPQTFTTTVTFWVLLGSIYYVIWEVAQLLRQSKK